MRRTALAIFVSLFFVFSAQRAFAQELEGKLHVGLTAALYGLERTRLETSTDTVVTDRTGMGSGLSPIGLVFGYAVHEVLSLGLRFGMGTVRADTADGLQRSRYVRMRILPNLTVLIPTTRGRFRPFLVGGIGAAREVLEVGGDTVERQRGIYLGTGLGTHFFVTESFSITSELAVGKARFHPRTLADDEHLSMLDVRFAFGVSGWFGGGRRETEGEAEPATAQPATRR